MLDETPPKKSVCFIYNQTGEKDVYKERAISVESCEKVIGFELFQDLSKSDRKNLLKEFDVSKWSEVGCR